jgi:hypothetical protein
VKYGILAVVVLAIVAVSVRSRGEKPETHGTPSPGSPRPLLRQFDDLCPQDFEQYPVWVDCHVVDYDEPWYDDTDEQTIRPWNQSLPADPAEATFLVRATLTLADATEISGFVIPQCTTDSGGKPDLGLIQPNAFQPDGKLVSFWFGILTPPQEVVSDFYSALDRRQEDVFPILFRVEEGLATGITAGSIPGFCSIGKDGEIKVVR